MMTAGGSGFVPASGAAWARLGLFVAVGAVVGGVVGLLGRSRGRSHRQGVEEESGRLGFAYREGADDVLGRFPGASKMPLFRDWYAGANRMTGHVRGTSVEVFDYTTRRSSADARGEVTTHSTRRTVVLLPGLGLPDFEMMARGTDTKALEMAGTPGLTFGAEGLAGADLESVEAFRRAYHVDRLGASTGADDGDDSEAVATASAPRDERAIRHLFPIEVARALADRPGWSAQSSGGDLALWRGMGGDLSSLFGGGAGFVRPEGRGDLIEDGVAISEALRRPAPAGLGADASPGPRRVVGGAPGPIGGGSARRLGRGDLRVLLRLRDVRRLGVRPRREARDGRGRRDDHRPGGLRAGVGGPRLAPGTTADPHAGRWHRVARPSARAPLSSPWISGGCFAGFVLGAGIGLAATVPILPHKELIWAFPLLFFGGAGAGAGLGLFLGGCLAIRRRA